MFFLNILRWFSGYVVFGGTGGFPERFLNLCSANGISVWDAKSAGGILTAKTSVKGYKKIRLCAKRSGMRIRLKEKKGLPFVLKPYKQRKGLAVGAVLSAALLIFLNSAVWTISVEGNDKYTKEQILSIAESYGIRQGAFRKNIDITEIRTNIKASVPEINWFTVNMDGSHITLNVSENKGDSEIYDRTTPCNIVSSVDGEVVKLDAYEGNAEVLIGSAVAKGDLLISGVVEKFDGTPDFVHARGEAIVRTRKNISADIPKTLNVTLIEEIRIRKLPILFGIEIPLTPMKPSDSIRTEKNMLEYEGKRLPVGMKTEYNYYFSSAEKELSEDEETLLAGYELFIGEKDIMQNAETEEKNIAVFRTESGVKADISYVNLEKTGTEQFFEVEQQGDNIINQ